MEPTSMTREAGSTPLSARPAIASDLPIGRTELAELARWFPAKEMALLIEICDRASRDPDLLSPALLLCSPYAHRVARMLDQDPVLSLTRSVRDCLQPLRWQQGMW